MKTNLLKLTTALVLLAMQFTGCADRLSSGYVLEFPDAPAMWVSLLGEPSWRVEWFDSGGGRRTADISSGSGGPGLEVQLPSTWANPVGAWPYWPEHKLIPGHFRPAGALFPFDVRGGRLRLSWEAGPDMVFYLELARANEENYSRLPANFDWPRFRSLFQDEALSEAVREDPWLIDWRSVAEKTVLGSFDRRRLVPEEAKDKIIPVSAGFWYGSSPFAQPLFFAEEEPSTFPVRAGVNVWISTEGILRVDGDVWAFTAGEKAYRE